MKDTPDLLRAAIEYLDAGLSIIALEGKMPNRQVHRRGLNEALSGTVETKADRQMLDRLFRHPATTGVGILIPPHMVVVDIDGEEGAEQYWSLAQAVPNTAAARTGRGLHLWFHTAHVRRSTKLGLKLDLKGVGGYVAAPPSRHPDGHVYQWLDPLVQRGRVNADFLPDAIEKLLDTRDAIAAENSIVLPRHIEHRLVQQDGRMVWQPTELPYPIDGLIHAVEKAEPGERNNLLAWAAMTARDEGVKLEDALRSLGAAAEKAGLGNPEIRTTIRSAYRRGSRK